MNTLVWQTNGDGTVSVSTDGTTFSTPFPSASTAAAIDRVRGQWETALQQAIDAVGPSVPFPWAMAILFNESGGNPTAKSPAGAIGLMQVLPSTANKTAAELGNAQINLRAGVNYLQSFINDAHDLPAVASMYNAGFNPVTRRPWTNEETSAKFQSPFGFRSDPGYIANVIAASNHIISGGTGTGIAPAVASSGTKATPAKVASVASSKSALPVLLIGAGIFGAKKMGWF